MELSCIATREAKLSSLLRRELQMSSTLVNRLKYTGAYTVNGRPVRTNFPVRPGDQVRVCLDEPRPEYPAGDGPLAILYEDDWLIALDKPPGKLMHPSSCRNTGTLANDLLGYYDRTGQACAVHPVSRLDRDTFGVVLLAKNAHAHALLGALAREGAVKKTYHAAVLGQPPAPEGVVDAPIARQSETSLLRCIRPDGQPACSAYRVLARGPLPCAPSQTAALLELHPLTGRTHQLRLHCAYLGCPILGDPQYGTAESQALSQALGLRWQQLCAVSLHFPHPIEKKILKIHTNQVMWLDFPAQELYNG